MESCSGILISLSIINDTYGHAAGDAAIIAVAKILESVMEGQGLTGRLGGDEFICILSEVDEDNYAIEFENKVKNMLTVYNMESKQEYELSISFGFAIWKHDDFRPLDDILAESDKSLYKKKQNFR